MHKTKARSRATEYINELLNSRITLNDKEIAIVEDFIERQSTDVKPEHLNHYKCIAAIRSGLTTLRTGF